jgi:hypothetical protein
MTPQQQQMFANTTHCPICARCFCKTHKVEASNHAAVCAVCRPEYEKRIQLAISNSFPFSQQQ